MTRLFKYIIAILFVMAFAATDVTQAYMSTPSAPSDVAANGQFTIVVDPGHGGQDSGAISGKIEEKDITLALARKLSQALRKIPGMRVLMTRDSDVYVPLNERTAFANKSKADVFISIHVNSAPKKDVSGIETYFLNVEATDDDARRLAAAENNVSTRTGAAASKTDALSDILFDLTRSAAHHESSSLAEAVHMSLVAGTGRESRGVKQAPFTVLSGALMPATLVEVGFISNSAEVKKITSSEDQTKTAASIAKGIENFKKFTSKDQKQIDRLHAGRKAR